ncbi:hypothetical protein C1645_782652 [Glomus cerebriforme]|uniref:Uncharacterized protein n=1 Tax=Glomus cerebriforme TaxID=658196 RepID=A0A397S3B6_9GLOM|nr:hypothetical protein C1645_795279 [Glomus cerebriforme]RIA85109.1 hypothetical protein C1645_782652 [Glomus cerebriforme]
MNIYYLHQDIINTNTTLMLHLMHEFIYFSVIYFESSALKYIRNILPEQFIFHMKNFIKAIIFRFHIAQSTVLEN